MSRKNWQGGGELLLKNGTMNSYAYKPCFDRARFTLRGALKDQKIFAKSCCQL